MAMEPASDQKSVLAVNWGLYMGAGILLMPLGAVAILVPAAASLCVTIFTGWVLIMIATAGKQTAGEA